MKRRPSAIVTCEHASASVPTQWRDHFTARETAQLETHKGYDIGALEMARVLARLLDAPLLAGGVTRLLVDINRSEGNRRGIFGPAGKRMDDADRERALQRWHRPFRKAVAGAVERGLASGKPVIMLSIHSFTPRLKGMVRSADIGLLYDPSRKKEKALCLAIRESILKVYPHARIRMNYPYRGIGDGTASAIRKAFPQASAVEIEFNQGTMRGFSASKIAGAIADGARGGRG